MSYGLTHHAEILICLKRKSHKLRQAAELYSKVHTRYLANFKLLVRENYRLNISPFDHKKKRKSHGTLLFETESL